MDEDGYILTPCGTLGGNVSVSQYGKCLKVCRDTDAALDFMSDRMVESGFFPNIYWVSDHGNWWRIDTEGEEMKEG